MIGSIDSRFHQHLQAALNEHLAEKATELAAGRATTFDDYRFRVGLIKGLETALVLAQEVERRLSGNPNRTSTEKAP